MSAEASAKADWPTAGHDFQRTSYNAACPKPPYKWRWAWYSGERMDPTKVEKTKYPYLDLFGTMESGCTARFMPTAQAVIKGDGVYIGSVEGEMFCIDRKTGSTRWKAKASGTIGHCATATDDAVYVGTTRGVDAFSLDGKRLWTFSELDGGRVGGFWSCPAVFEGIVLIGGTSGVFYGLDARTGKPAWEFGTGAPIYHTPALHGGAVFFGSENMLAYCLDAKTGKEKWRTQLYGQSFFRSWPVVAAKHGAVIFRTEGIGHGGAFGAVEKAPFDHRQAHEALREWVRAHPKAQTIYVLNLSDGKEKVFVATGDFGGSGEMAHPPIVDDKGTAYSLYISKEGAFQAKGAFGAWGNCLDFGRINFETGCMDRIADVGTLSHPAITRIDDTYVPNIAGSLLFGTYDMVNYMPLDGSSKKPLGLGPHRGLADPLYRMGKGGFQVGTPWHWGGHVGPTVVDDLIVVNTTMGFFLYACETAK